MKSRKIQNATILILETGEEVVSILTRFAKEQNISSGHFTAIGAFRSAVIGYFDWEKKDYFRNEVNEQVEVVSLLGGIALDQGTPKLHAHVVLGRRDGTASGGHLLEGHVRPMLELVLEDSQGRLKRKFDPESQLALIDVSE